MTIRDKILYLEKLTVSFDGFKALDGLDVSVRIAVASEEGPAELREAADLTVAGPQELLAVLRGL